MWKGFVQDDGVPTKLFFAHLFIDCEEGLKFMQESEEMITLSSCHEQKTSKPPICAAFLIRISIQAYNGASRVG
jgi:hypothetical protein